VLLPWKRSSSAPRAGCEGTKLGRGWARQRSSSPCWTCCWQLTLLAPTHWWKIKLQATSAAVPPPAHPVNIPFSLYFWHFKPASAAIQVYLLQLCLIPLTPHHPTPRLRTFISSPRLNAILSLPGCLAQNTATDNPQCLPTKLRSARPICRPLFALLHCWLSHLIHPLTSAWGAWVVSHHPSHITIFLLPRPSHWVRQGPCLECGSAIGPLLVPAQCTTLGWLSPRSPVEIFSRCVSGFGFLHLSALL